MSLVPCYHYDLLTWPDLRILLSPLPFSQPGALQIPLSAHGMICPPIKAGLRPEPVSSPDRAEKFRFDTLGVFRPQAILGVSAQGMFGDIRDLVYAILLGVIMGKNKLGEGQITRYG